jgi:hypothetical protein
MWLKISEFVFFVAKKRSNKDKKKLTPPLPFEIFFTHTVTIEKNMRTKTLLIAAAALAAGLVSSQAQTVYSANVVGYANVVLAGNGGYTLVANPLDDGNGNQLTNILSSSLPTKSQVLTWNGTSYNTAITKGAGGWASSISLPPGTGFFVKNGIAGSAPVTNTFVGSVVANAGSSVTNALPTLYTLVGSPIPYAADATTDTNINLAGLANKSQLLDWNSGTQQYDTADTKGSAGWGAAFPVSVGQGFFVKTLVPTNWTQSFNP